MSCALPLSFRNVKLRLRGSVAPRQYQALSAISLYIRNPPALLIGVRGQDRPTFSGDVGCFQGIHLFDYTRGRTPP